MNASTLVAKVRSLTGRLEASARAPAGELARFERTLAQLLRADPGLVVKGNRLAHETPDDLDPVAGSLAERFAHLEEVLASPPGDAGDAASPRIFRRETAFRSTLLGSSVPAWATGMAPAQSFGPFLDEHGLEIWFDLFHPTRFVSLYVSGRATPLLRVPIWGVLAGRQSYRVEAGSVWIAAELIAPVAALQGSCTGLKVTGGSIELSQAATVSGANLVIKPTTRLALHLDLDQPAAAAAAAAAGGDAAAAAVQLPRTFDLRVHAPASEVTAGDAACTPFGCAVALERSGQPPRWLAIVNHILIPYAATTQGDDPHAFAALTSKSPLCTVSGRAAIDAATTGWLLPVTKADPLTLGAAAGTGALCIGIEAGLDATWKDLKGGKTTLTHPAIILEPGLLSVLDLAASNPEGRQRWMLWRNATSTHASDVALSFGKAFPFLFLSSAAGAESLLFFCGLTARVDRPVDANGVPFRVESPTALVAISQTGTKLHARVIDSDLADGQAANPSAVEQHGLALRNAFFTVSAARSLSLAGDLEDGRITAGSLALGFDVRLYLPTLPDPYVASYTPYLRDPASLGFARPQQALTGFVKWPDGPPPAAGADEPSAPRALVYFKFTPLSQSVAAQSAGGRGFLTEVSTFDQDLLSRSAQLSATVPTTSGLADAASPAALPGALAERVEAKVRSGELGAAVAALEANPLLRHIPDKPNLVARTLEASLRAAQRAEPAALAAVASQREGSAISDRIALGRDLLMLLDVSSHADQMGVSLGTAWRVERDERGDAMLRAIGGIAAAQAADGTLPLRIMNMDVVTAARNVRATTLPHISWEPIWNIPLAIEGAPDPADTITVTPGLVVYDNDGIPTRIFSQSADFVPVAPLPVTRHFLKEFNDDALSQALHSVFTLPFAMVARADFLRAPSNPDGKNAHLDFNMPHFDRLRGALQIQARSPDSPTPARVSATCPGWTIQLDNIRWFLFGAPLQGSTLGKTVRDVFNQRFRPGGDKPAVPLERIELCGYGASIFSNWLDADATIADVSQTQFDVVVGRTAHEVVQIRSILYPFGVHVVRTITLMRSNNGYVFRSDSGWKAESDGFYDFSYTLSLQELGTVPVANPYEFHGQPVKGVSHVREIRDFPDAGAFTSSFALNDPDLPPELKALTLTQWKKVFAGATSLAHVLDVKMQAVVFDADVHLDNVLVGGTSVGGEVVVQSRKMLGYVQLAPASILVPDRIFAELLAFQSGSLGGPVDCVIDVARSEQRMRLSRVDVNPAKDAAGKSVFVTAARGSLVLPQDGSWSVVRQDTASGDVKPVPPQEGVPLIKPNGSATYLLAHPADVHVPSSGAHYGVLQSTGTQKLLFDVPQFSPNVAKLKSAQTYFADAYKLLNSKGVFPNVANALGLTTAEREVEILGEGLMRMADRTLKLSSLLPANYQYAFIDEPGVLKIYAEYRSTDNQSGELALGIDSAAALEKRWKAALSKMRVVVDLGPFTELMWIDGNFDAASGISTKLDKPNLQFGDVLRPVVEILEILKSLTGDDFDSGMSVGMSNSPDNWEYKFNCSKEIPVIKFPSPEQLTINPNPPLKLEAGLRVGFYFNEVLSVPTDLKQLVPACGAYMEFYGGLEVQCFTLAVASVYAVGRVTLGIAADSKAGITLHMKFGFGAEVVVGLPVVANVSVLYMVEVEVSINASALDVAGLLLFRGSAEICGGLVAICIQIEAGGSVHRDPSGAKLTAQVTFSIDVCVLWVIDINVTEHWQEQRQIA